MYGRVVVCFEKQGGGVVFVPWLECEENDFYVTIIIREPSYHSGTAQATFFEK